MYITLRYANICQVLTELTLFCSVKIVLIAPRQIDKPKCEVPSKTGNLLTGYATTSF